MCFFLQNITWTSLNEVKLNHRQLDTLKAYCRFTVGGWKLHTKVFNKFPAVTHIHLVIKKVDYRQCNFQRFQKINALISHLCRVRLLTQVMRITPTTLKQSKFWSVNIKKMKIWSFYVTSLQIFPHWKKSSRRRRTTITQFQHRGTSIH